MKLYFAIFAVALMTFRVTAGTDEAPVKLAIVAETDEASPAVDVLTAQLTSNTNIQLLERDAINKIHHEQGRSSANRDDLKLGRLLGADGVLFLNVLRTPQATNLIARLTAVKPGVVLTEGSFVWPLTDAAQWSQSMAEGLEKFLPKLAVLTRDAIPISVVNLRSAIDSDEGREIERDMNLLTIQRLSAEPQLFVLERQKMQLLGEEKDLQSNESAFWDGSYLLDGVIDQNGYSKDTVTINARLTPPKGGAPMQFEISGSRTNLAEAIHLLTDKINDLLKVNSAIMPGDSIEEAKRYFDEAGWALKWGVFAEAQATADAAWALGKRDMECATLRIRSYDGPLEVRGYQKGEFTNPQNTNQVVQLAASYAAPNTAWGLKLHTQDYNGIKSVEYVYAYQFPNPTDLDLAALALDIYYQFSRNSPDGLLRVASEQSNWKNSEWYNLGIEDLTAASMVLEHFNFVPEAQKPVDDRLAELRQSARRVADWISRAPAVRDSYFVGDRIATYDELANTMDHNPTIFRCEADWGCFWQEKPDDALALYRKLMSSPIFCYVHSDLWLRDLPMPRLVAWNETDRQRIPFLWTNFLDELNNSTNVLCRLEARAFALADADGDKEVAMSFTNLLKAIFENREALVNNTADIAYLNWHVGDLVEAKTGGSLYSDLRDSLSRLYFTQYSPQLDGMEQEYRSKIVAGAQASSRFQQQEEYLREQKPFDFFKFVTLFQPSDFSRQEAKEILPLIVAYKSNLVAQSQTAAGAQRGRLIAGIGQMGFLENDVNRSLNSPTPQPLPQHKTTESPSANARTVAIVPAGVPDTKTPELITNVVKVIQAFSIPMEKLLPPDGSQRLNDGSLVTVTAHHFCNGKLLLDLQYNLGIGEGTQDYSDNLSGTAIAIFDLTKRTWDVIALPRVDIPALNRYYNRTTLVNGSLYHCDGGMIQKFDFVARQWQPLKISDGNNYELFGVNGQLYAANGNVIFEIDDGGDSTRILASNRRQPPASVLDTQNLGTPVLFEGPNHVLRLNTGSKVFTQAGNGWSFAFDVPSGSTSSEVFLEGVLFRANQGDLSLSFLPVAANTPQIFFWQRAQAQPGLGGRHSIDQMPSALWNMPSGLSLGNLAAAVHESDLFLLADHSQAQVVAGQRAWEGNIGNKYLPKDGYEATLLCYSRDLSAPQKVYLNFDAPDSCQPLTGTAPNTPHWLRASPPEWMFVADGFLIFGLEIPINGTPYPGTRTDVGGKATVWLLPLSQVEEARATQKQTQFRRQAQAVASVERVQKELLSKFDLNHNGVIDPDEKEEALDDPAFIQASLDEINTNHNGWLDASDLNWFDANKNKILDSKEQAGIDLALKFLAEKLLNQFDEDGNGRLTMKEYNEMVASSLQIPLGMDFDLQFTHADANHDNRVDLEELQKVMRRHLENDLQFPGLHGALRIMPGMDGEPAGLPEQRFKSEVEAYWKNAGRSDQTPVGARPPISPNNP